MIDDTSVCYPWASSTGRNCRNGWTEAGEEASSPQLNDRRPGFMTEEKGI
jgi:hypothetical protein